MLIERRGYRIQRYNLSSSGSCPSCGNKIPGRWASSFEGQITASPLHSRRSRVSDPLHIIESTNQ